MIKKTILLIVLTLTFINCQNESNNESKKSLKIKNPVKTDISFLELKSSKKPVFFTDKAGQTFVFEEGILKRRKKTIPPPSGFRPICPGGTIQASGYVDTWTERCPERDGHVRTCQQIKLMCTNESGNSTAVNGRKTCGACFKTGDGGLDTPIETEPF